MERDRTNKQDRGRQRSARREREREPWKTKRTDRDIECMKRDRANKQDRGRHRSAWRKTGKRNRTEKDIGAHEKRHGKQTYLTERYTKVHGERQDRVTETNISAWRERETVYGEKR